MFVSEFTEVVVAVRFELNSLLKIIVFASWIEGIFAVQFEFNSLIESSLTTMKVDLKWNSKSIRVNNLLIDENVCLMYCDLNCKVVIIVVK